MRLNVVLFESEEGYAVNVPALPGCWSQGATEAEALTNISIAVQEYFVAANALADQQDNVRLIDIPA